MRIRIIFRYNYVLNQMSMYLDHQGAEYARSLLNRSSIDKSSDMKRREPVCTLIND